MIPPRRTSERGVRAMGLARTAVDALRPRNGCGIVAEASPFVPENRGIDVEKLMPAPTQGHDGNIDDVRKEPTDADPHPLQHQRRRLRDHSGRLAAQAPIVSDDDPQRLLVTLRAANRAGDVHTSVGRGRSTEKTTMRYMLLLYDNDDTREAFFGPGSEGLGAEVDAVLAELRESGELVATDPLADPAQTRTVVTDGPLAETKEHFAGYLIVDCDSPERAVAIAARWPSARFAPLEVRPIMEIGGPDL
jgi:hypothetical protein